MKKIRQLKQFFHLQSGHKLYLRSYKVLGKIYYTVIMVVIVVKLSLLLLLLMAIYCLKSEKRWCSPTDKRRPPGSETPCPARWVCWNMCSSLGRPPLASLPQQRQQSEDAAYLLKQHLYSNGRDGLNFSKP